MFAEFNMYPEMIRRVSILQMNVLERSTMENVASPMNSSAALHFSETKEEKDFLGVIVNKGMNLVDRDL